MRPWLRVSAEHRNWTLQIDRGESDNSKYFKILVSLTINAKGKSKLKHTFLFCCRLGPGHRLHCGKGKKEEWKIPDWLLYKEYYQYLHWGKTRQQKDKCQPNFKVKDGENYILDSLVCYYISLWPFTTSQFIWKWQIFTSGVCMPGQRHNVI